MGDKAKFQQSIDKAIQESKKEIQLVKSSRRHTNKLKQLVQTLAICYHNLAKQYDKDSNYKSAFDNFKRSY